jgi:hypothetical protein
MGYPGGCVQYSGTPSSTTRLILVPALISLGVTTLRLFGELQHWPKPLVNNAVCGRAILGVAWLVPVFGIYFGFKLFGAGKGPKRLGQAIGFAVLGLTFKLAGTLVMETPGMGYPDRLGINLVLTVTGLVLPALAWRALFKALLAYGYAARIPIAIVQFLAMRGNWGTHYDALDPGFPPLGFWPKFIRVSLVPNVFFMEAYTVIVGTVLGSIALAIIGRVKPAPQFVS